MTITTPSLLRAEPDVVFREAFKRFKNHGVVVRPPCNADIREIKKALRWALEEAHDIYLGNGDDHTSGKSPRREWMVEVDWDHMKAITITFYQRFSV